MQAASAALTGMLYASNQIFQSGEFKSVLGTLPNVPGWVPIVLACIALLTFIAHGRE